MVGSRTSASETFIRDVTCAISVDPPTQLCNPTASSTAGSTIVVQNGVPVSVNIYSDPYPHELSWKITDLSEQVLYASAPFGAVEGDKYEKLVMLPPGDDLRFTIADARDDGIFGDIDATLYELVLMDQGVNSVLIGGNGQFTTSHQEQFRVPLPNEYPSLATRPRTQDAVKLQTPVSGQTVTVYVYFKFSSYHEDLSWSIIDAVDQSIVYASVAPDVYRFGDDVTEEVELPSGSYKFTCNDRRGVDEYRAFESYKVTYRNTEGEMIPLFESQGAFIGETRTHNFVIPTLIGSGASGSTIPGNPFVTTNDPILTGSGGSDQCKGYGLGCAGALECCSGRCAMNMCRDSTVSRGRGREQLGRSSARGGAASRVWRTTRGGGGGGGTL
jgi:hypothetical protein